MHEDAQPGQAVATCANVQECGCSISGECDGQPGLAKDLSELERRCSLLGSGDSSQDFKGADECLSLMTQDRSVGYKGMVRLMAEGMQGEEEEEGEDWRRNADSDPV